MGFVVIISIANTVIAVIIRFVYIMMMITNYPSNQIIVIVIAIVIIATINTNLFITITTAVTTIFTILKVIPLFCSAQLFCA